MLYKVVLEQKRLLQNKSACQQYQRTNTTRVGYLTKRRYLNCNSVYNLLSD